MKKLTEWAPQEARYAYGVAGVPLRWFDVSNLGKWALRGEASDQHHGSLLHHTPCARWYSTVDNDAPHEPYYVPVKQKITRCIQLDCRSARRTQNINLPMNQKGLQHLQGHRWKALGKENLDLPSLFFCDNFLTFYF